MSAGRRLVAGLLAISGLTAVVVAAGDARRRRLLDSVAIVRRRAVETALEVRGRWTETTTDVRGKWTDAALDVRDRWTETADELRARAADTAGDWRERSNENLERALFTAAERRDAALDDDAEDEEDPQGDGS